MGVVKAIELFLLELRKGSIEITEIISSSIKMERNATTTCDDPSLMVFTCLRVYKVDSF